jgi:hypothetical protein
MPRAVVRSSSTNKTRILVPSRSMRAGYHFRVHTQADFHGLFAN